MVSPDETLALAEQIEVLAAEQYAFLTERFAKDDEAAELFLRLRNEELQHVQRVRMVRQRFTLRRRLVKGVEPVAESLKRILVDAESTFAILREKSSSLSFEEAKSLMRDVENQLMAAHAEALDCFVDEEFRTFFEQLAEQDRAHARLLD